MAPQGVGLPPWRWLALCSLPARCCAVAGERECPSDVLLLADHQSILQTLRVSAAGAGAAGVGAAARAASSVPLPVVLDVGGGEALMEPDDIFERFRQSEGERQQCKGERDEARARVRELEEKLASALGVLQSKERGERALSLVQHLHGRAWAWEDSKSTLLLCIGGLSALALGFVCFVMGQAASARPAVAAVGTRQPFCQSQMSPHEEREDIEHRSGSAPPSLGSAGREDCPPTKKGKRSNTGLGVAAAPRGRQQYVLAPRAAPARSSAPSPGRGGGTAVAGGGRSVTAAGREGGYTGKKKDVDRHYLLSLQGLP